MAVNNELPILSTQGGVTHYDFKFRVIEASDLKVFQDGVVVPTANYTVTLNGDAGGSVDFKTAPPASSTIMLRRETPFTRATDYQDNGDLLAQTIDDDFDRLWLALQEEQASSDITLSKPVGVGAWDAKAIQIENLADGTADTDAATVGQVKTLNGGAQNSANASAASAAASLQSEQNASVHAGNAAGSATAAAASAAAALQSERNAAVHAGNAAGSATAAATSATQAAGSAAAAATSQAQTAGVVTAAEAARDVAIQARDAALNVAPGNYMLKTNNLTDVADPAQAWANVYKGLTGPLALKADAALPYDAVTLRQLQAVGGSGGANMSGVMNNFIGAVEWFNGTRAKLPAGYIPADGQEESQTDPKTADLYAAVNADMFVSVTEALWQNSGNADATRAGENRGAYVKQSSAGKFRVPDLNGASADAKTPRANFLRGDGGGAISAAIGGVGAIKANAAPNILGTVGFHGAQAGQGFGPVNSASGAFIPGNIQNGYPNTQKVTGANGFASVDFNANGSNKVYGREGTTEVRPNSVTGIWIIRASGAFQAAKTEFGAYNSLTTATLPPAGTMMTGGMLKSSLMLDGMGNANELCAASMDVIQNRGDKYSQIRWGCYHKGTTGTTGADPDTLRYLAFSSNGDLYVPESLALKGDKARFHADSGAAGQVQIDVYSPGGIARLAVGGGYTTRKGSGGPWGGAKNEGNLFNFDWGSTDGGLHDLHLYIDTTDCGRIAFDPASDRELKKDIAYRDDAEDVLAQVNAWRVASFTMRERGDVVRESRGHLGFIANDMIAVSPECVKGSGIQPGEDINNNDVFAKAYWLDQMAIIAKLTQAVQALTARVKELEAKG